MRGVGEGAAKRCACALQSQHADFIRVTDKIPPRFRNHRATFCSRNFRCANGGIQIQRAGICARFQRRTVERDADFPHTLVRPVAVFSADQFFANPTAFFVLTV